MKRHYSITVRGASSEWCFDVYAKPEHVEDWRADGLEVDEVVNTIPEWAPPKLWCFIQDILTFKMPFK